MDSRMSISGAAAMLCLAAYAFAAPPLAGSWNITPTGNAASSGELLFRVTPGSGEDPIEVTVSVLSGATDVSVARKIRQTLSSQLRRDQYTVELGEGTNVLLSDPRGRPNFSLELVNSDIANLRVAVRNIEPAASPTVPAQSVPAAAPPAAAGQQPANASPDNGAQPAAPPSSIPNGAPAAPLPNPTPNGSPSAPLPNSTPNGSPAAPPPSASPGATPASTPPPTA